MKISAHKTIDDLKEIGPKALAMAMWQDGDVHNPYPYFTKEHVEFQCEIERLEMIEQLNEWGVQ